MLAVLMVSSKGMAGVARASLIVVTKWEGQLGKIRDDEESVDLTVLYGDDLVPERA